MNIAKGNCAGFWGLLLLATQVYAEADKPPPLCAGPEALLATMNNGGFGDSPCTVSDKSLLTEFNYNYLTLYQQSGFQHTFPFALFRIGLPQRTEINFAPPTAVLQSFSPRSGNSNSILGLKHELVSRPKSLLTGEAFLYFPDGSVDYGAAGFGSFLNLIYSYSLDQDWSITAIMGYSRQADSRANGGRYYNFWLPDVILSLAVNEKTSLIAEVYGQTRVSSTLGAGYITDCGLIYLFKPNVGLSIDYGQRLSGQLLGVNQYLQLGLSVLIN